MTSKPGGIWGMHANTLKYLKEFRQETCFMNKSSLSGYMSNYTLNIPCATFYKIFHIQKN